MDKEVCYRYERSQKREIKGTEQKQMGSGKKKTVRKEKVRNRKKSWEQSWEWERL